MAEITSREELEEWLKDKPADWARVIAARAALRVLPYSLSSSSNISHVAKVLFRAAWTLWAVCDNPEDFNRREALDFAAFTLVPKLSKSSFAQSTLTMAVFCTSISPDLANSVPNLEIADVSAGVVAQSSLIANYEIWQNVYSDCKKLELQEYSEENHFKLLKSRLWLGVRIYDWSNIWRATSDSLTDVDSSFQVWIDWYNRRIEGHDAAFDIPGDIERTHDKAVLARLADATDENFWGKGATYVNTTLQSWIDEARIEARIEEILRKLRSGAAAHYGAPEELAGRAALLDELDRLLGKSPEARHGIGGNYPPEPIGAVEQAVALPSEMREPLEAISTELEKREPDAIAVVEQVKLLHRIARKLEKMASIAGDKFAEGFGEELGKSGPKLIRRGLYAVIASPVILKILDWIAPFIH